MTPELPSQGFLLGRLDVHPLFLSMFLSFFFFCLLSTYSVTISLLPAGLGISCSLFCSVHDGENKDALMTCSLFEIV
jgi:hypothetical protein